MITTEKNIIVKRVSFTDENVQRIVALLDRYQRFLYGEQYCNLETIESLQNNQAYMTGAYAGEKLIGIGAVKLSEHYGEIKRMFVEKKYRGTGAAAAIIDVLERYTRQQNRTQVKLETGNLQFAAIGFYEKQGYWETDAFGTYKANPVSIYFEKNI